MSVADELGEALDEHLIEGLAGSAAFGRGVGYLHDGRVQAVEDRDGQVHATVRGTVPYRVELGFDGDELTWHCSCPAAEDGSFCKHCTAVTLSLMHADDLPDNVGRPAQSDSDRADPDHDQLEDFVRRIEPERLAEIVLRQAAGDWRLREQLMSEAAAAHGLGPDVSKWRRRVGSAFNTGGFVHYRDAAGWAEGVNDVIDALADLADAGHRVAVIDLVEHGYRRANRVMGSIDDSDGWLTLISERLADLHLQACEASRPEPVALAKRLTKLELDFELEGFHRSAATYAEVLGPVGLAAFRKAIEPKWSQIEPARDEWSTGDFRLRQAMIGWALGIGDPDALIEAHRHARIHPTDMLEIAEAYEAAGRDDEAAEWARKGLSGLGHGSWQAGGLRDFLARKLREQGDAGAAVDLYWNAFTASPSLEACRTLLRQDDRPSGPDWLERCLQHLRSRLETSSSTGSSPPTLPTDVMATAADAAPATAIVLVEILLHEGRVEEAWEVALQHGTRWQMWMALARAREATAPRDSIAIYESQALAVINRKKPNQYRVAVDLMSRIRRLAAEAGDPTLFDSLLHRVRTDHKAKRRLQSEMNDLSPLADEREEQV